MRQLATDLFRRGDLYARSLGRAVDAEEGRNTQKAVQRERFSELSSYERERTVTLQRSMQAVSGTTVALEISGRMDGFAVREQDTLIEEFKACSIHPEVADPVDWGQLYLYAGLYAAELGSDEALLARLVYVEVDTLKEKRFEVVLRCHDLVKTLEWHLALYSVAWQRQELHLDQRQAWAGRLRFPMPQFRRGQQALARRVYQAIKTCSNLLLEAPTGSGKSLAVLFPALKAMAHDAQLFFLTGRTSGREAALSALAHLDESAEQLVVVELTAKEKICFVEGMPCDPTLCQYADAYYDKVGDAIEAGLSSKWCDRTQIESTALAHEVCPFELSLDIALKADVIVGDYNYIFDPVVRLQRFMQAKHLHLLCDEAHQIVPRVREALTTEISRTEIKAAQKNCPSGLEPRVKSIDRAVMKYQRGLADGQHLLDSLDSVDRAARRLVEGVAELEVELSEYDEFRALYFSCTRWVRAKDWQTAGDYFHQVNVEGRGILVSTVCLDPSAYIQKVDSEFASSVRFSATLSPLKVTAHIQGCPDVALERAQNPFSPDQLSTFIVPNISTYYRDRSQSLHNLAHLVLDIYQAYPGKYLVALPSYEYLRQLQGILEGQLPVHEQVRGASTEVLEGLIADVGQHGGVLLVVMGGVLSESIDFMGARLDGVIVVGLGLPPPSVLRDQQVDHFDAAIEPGVGQLVAYPQPAMTKILQTAGRLIRDVEDRGIICLVDPRFRAPGIKQFFPEHWQVEEVHSEKVGIHVRKFWST